MPLTLDLSQTLIAAAQEHAYGAGLKVTVAVVDEGGLLKALGRMDGAPPLSAQIAEAKAAGAGVWHRDGDQLASVQDQRGAFFESVSRLTPTAPSTESPSRITTEPSAGISGSRVSRLTDSKNAPR